LEDLHVSDVLSAQAVVREIPVRNVGPAAVIVLEVGAIPRIVSPVYSNSEFAALTSWLFSDPASRRIIDAFDDTFRDEGGSIDIHRLERQRRHADRLQSGSTSLESLQRKPAGTDNASLVKLPKSFE
jgi:hypothetical protein